MVDVLIIAPINDVHALVVSRRLELLGTKVLILDTADYLARWSLTTTWRNGGAEILVRVLESGVTFDISKLKGVWYRRLWPFRVVERITNGEVQSFAYNECRDFIHGVLATYPNVINNPALEWAANRKVLQLETALRVGLRVPKTLISTEPRNVQEFTRETGEDAIFKCLTNTTFQFTETRRLEPSYLSLEGAISLAPTIFQERIKAQYHLRATYVDGEILTARLTIHQHFANTDWRLDPTRDIAAAVLDDDTATRVTKLMNTLGLRFGAIDFIVDDSERPCFLEINPSGQFLFCEIHAGLPISAAISAALAGERA
jgi:hypothetical protein